MLKKIQSVAFEQEIADPKANRPVKCRRALHTLNPFIQHDSFFYVGARLINPVISFTSKCVVLPSISKIIQLIFDYEHKY